MYSHQSYLTQATKSFFNAVNESMHIESKDNTNITTGILEIEKASTHLLPTPFVNEVAKIVFTSRDECVFHTQFNNGTVNVLKSCENRFSPTCHMQLYEVR